MKHSARFIWLQTAVLFAACFIATAPRAEEASFVAPERMHFMNFLAAPAPVASAMSNRELAELHQIEATRTPAQVVRAMADDKDESIFLFRDVIGADFTAQAFPMTALLSKHVGHDEGANTGQLKKDFARIRPYNTDKSLHPVCKTKQKNDSYPSGHTTAGYLQALTLIELFPEKRDAILARADDYAYNRMVCGVHFRSDIEAARLVAYSVHALMRENGQYEAELAAAKAEVRNSGLASSN